MTTPKIILGIDEVGRGPWAGPLVVGAVILGPNFKQHSDWEKLADSKQLTAKKRTELAPVIEQYACASATGWVSSTELDRYGMSASLKLATRRAVKQILATRTKFDEIIIDGTVNFLTNTPLEPRVTLLKKADSLIKDVSAASIIAKVARDNYMINLAKQYPNYGFEEHMGYGTAKHRAALLEYGPCLEHRQSFRPIQQLLDQSVTPTASAQSTGSIAELAVQSYLSQQGHTIITHNHRAKAYEIDLISIINSTIYFTEVKYSQKPATKIATVSRITPKKQAQMTCAAKAFLATHPQYSQYQPVLAAAIVEGEEFTIKNWFPLV